MTLPPDLADEIPSLLRALARHDSLKAAVASVPGLTLERARVLLDWTAEVLDEVDLSFAPEPPAAPRPLEVVPAGDHELIRIFTDGAARGNPGLAGAGAVLLDREGLVIERAAEFLGKATNNVAEYQAVILGLRRALDLGARRVELMSDSELLIRQLGGRYKVRAPHLLPLFAQAKKLLAGFESHRLRHVPREENSEADRLANMAIDERE